MWTDPGWFIYQVEVPPTFLYLSFSTLYSTSLGRTDTIIFSQLISPSPLSNGLETNKPPRGLNRGFTVLTLGGQYSEIDRYHIPKAQTRGLSGQNTVICMKLSTRGASISFLCVCSLERNAGKVCAARSPFWRPISQHFRKTTFHRQMKQMYIFQQIPRKPRRLACQCLLIGKNYFLDEFATKTWKCAWKIPETLSIKK